MNSNTKFFTQVYKLNSEMEIKLKVLKKRVIGSLFFLFLGFVFGNIFGTFLNYFRSFTYWDGSIIILTLFVIESINFLNYKKPKPILNLASVKSHLKLKKLKKEKTVLWWHKTIPTKKGYSSLDLLGQINTRGEKLHPSKSSEYVGNKKNNVSDLPGNDNFFDNFIKILHFYKMGLLLGFFIDAFKVGS